MFEDNFVIACLRLDNVPQFLLNPSEYQTSTCDFCFEPIWIMRKALQLVEAGEAGKACTSCIGFRLQLYTQAVMKQRIAP